MGWIGNDLNGAHRIEKVTTDGMGLLRSVVVRFDDFEYSMTSFIRFMVTYVHRERDGEFPRFLALHVM